jgi:Tol biopolymer transport system component
MLATMTERRNSPVSHAFHRLNQMSAVTLRLALVLLGLLAFGAACGDDDSTTATQTPGPTATASAPAATRTPIPAANLPIPNPWELRIAGTNSSGEKLLYSSDLPLTYAWSPDGETIAVAEGDQTTTTVRFLGLDGDEKASIDHNGYSQALSWSPDGKYVVTTFTTANGTTTSVLAIAADGSEQNVVVSQISAVSPMVSGWLPNGDLLLLNFGASPAGGLVAHDLDAGTSRAVSDLPVILDFFGRPAVSPDGKTLAVFSPAESLVPCEGGVGATAVYTIDLATGASTRVTPEIQCGSGGIVWSPDGKQIAFSALTFAETSGLFTVDVATGVTQRRTTGLDNATTWLEEGTILAQKYQCIGCDGGPPKLIAFVTEIGEVRDVIANNVPSAVSPAGSIVAADGDLKTISLDGTPLETIAQIANGWQYFQLAWSPDDTSVAYLRSRGQGQHYFYVNDDGTGFASIGSYEGTPSLSPDGSRLAYVTSEAQSNGKSFETLWLADADGTNAADVEVDGSVANFSWAPDGSRLIFSAIENPGEPGALYLVDADGTGADAIEADGLFVEAKTGRGLWSPNSKLVAFGELILEVDTGEVTEVGPVSGKGNAVWAADSEHLLFSDGSSNSIEIVAIDGSETTSVTPGGDRLIGSVGQSPDGERIAYWSAVPTSSNAEIHVMNSDGSDDVRVFSGPNLGGAPVWSPDSSSFAINASDGSRAGLYVISADGTQTRRLTRGGLIDSITWLDNNRLRFSTFVGGL